MMTQKQPTMPATLNGRHQHTFEAIFRHPVAHNLEWHDVRSLLEALGEVTEGSNGSLHVKRNGQMATLHIPKHKDVASVDDLMSIRHFLEKSAEPEQNDMGTASHLLLVLDHHEAKIYRTEMHGAIPQRLTPYDPHGFRHHLHSQNMMTDGHRAPERKSYYEAIAKTLRGAEQILIFSNGTGESNALQELLNDLKHNHHDVAEHIVGSMLISENHQTDEQLLAKAREFFSAKDN